MLPECFTTALVNLLKSTNFRIFPLNEYHVFTLLSNVFSSNEKKAQRVSYNINATIVFLLNRILLLKVVLV